MILWGLALAIGPNPNSRYMNLADDPEDAGYAAIRAAKGAISELNEVERGLVRALDVLLDVERRADRTERDLAFIAATRELLRRPSSG